MSLSCCVRLSSSLMSLMLPVRMDWSLLRVTDRRNHLCVQSPASVVLSVRNVSMWFVMFVIMLLVLVMCWSSDCVSGCDVGFVDKYRL